MNKLIITGILALGLTSCTTSIKSLEARDFTKMQGTEISSLLPGNSLRGKDKTGRYVIHYTSGNTMSITYATRKRTRRDVGTWRVAGDQYCRQWTALGKGEERCVTFYKRGDAIHWVLDDQVTDRSVFVQGNPANL